MSKGEAPCDGGDFEAKDETCREMLILIERIKGSLSRSIEIIDDMMESSDRILSGLEEIMDAAERGELDEDLQ